ncbi:MAG: hypothetical protein M3273_01510 [Actinomycetota bacterium]|nr:hypothetical protein [Actinomycetota bacterium]
MRRHPALLLIVAAVAVLSPAEGVAGPAKGIAVRTYYVVAGNGNCVLSTSTDSADGTSACSLSRDAVTSVTPSEPVDIPVADGLPLTLDVAQPVRGKVSVRSTTVFSRYGPLGAGTAQLSARLTGIAGGKEVLVGEATTDPYTVTPASDEYVVEFVIEPARRLAGVALDELTLTLEVSGTAVRHGGIHADGASRLTLGIASAR